MSEIKVFIGSVYCENEWNEAAPKYCLIRMDEQSLAQIAWAKAALHVLYGIGCSEIRVEVVCNTEWRKWLTREEVVKIRQGEISTSLDSDELEDTIQPEDYVYEATIPAVEMEAEIRGEVFCIGRHDDVYLSAFMKYSEDGLKVPSLDLAIPQADLESSGNCGFPVLEQFSHRLAEVKEVHHEPVGT